MNKAKASHMFFACDVSNYVIETIDSMGCVLINGNDAFLKDFDFTASVWRNLPYRPTRYRRVHTDTGLKAWSMNSEDQECARSSNKQNCSASNSV